MKILGAGGHARPVVECALAMGKVVECVIDLSFKGKDESILSVPVKGLDALDESSEVFIAFGDNEKRKELYDKYRDRVVTLVHPTAKVAEGAVIGNGTYVGQGAIIGADVKIGANCIINTGCIIDHECVIGDDCHITPGVRIAGRVKVEGGTYIGIGSSIKDNISICRCIIGAGSVVVKEIMEEGTYVGVPAKKIK